MRYWFTILLAMLYVLGEVWRFGSWDQVYIVAFSQDWYHWLKEIAGQAQWIVISLMVITYRKNKINDTSAIVFLLWNILDTFWYFYNYKTDGYPYVYLFLPVAWILTYQFKHRKCSTK